MAEPKELRIFIEKDKDGKVHAGPTISQDGTVKWVVTDRRKYTVEFQGETPLHDKLSFPVDGAHPKPVAGPKIMYKYNILDEDGNVVLDPTIFVDP